MHRCLKSLAVAAVFASISMGSMAETEKVGDYTWTYRIKDGTAEIYQDYGNGNGSSAASPLPKGAITIPSTLGGKPVTSIGNNAFYCCGDLTSVTIPKGVTTIYDAFQHCNELTSVTIPDSVTAIGEGAFWSCLKLTNVRIPNSVKSIGFGAFNDCHSLTDVAIPDSVTSIGASAFRNCHSLTLLTMPKDGVRCIEDGAFYGCVGLTSIKIPVSVIRLGNGAFGKCDNLARVGFRGDAPVVGKDAFSGVSPECRVYLPEGNPTYKLANGVWQGMKVEWHKAKPPKETNSRRNAVENKSARRIAQSTMRVGTGLYMVIDLSGGKGAEQFPVTYLNAEPVGGWTDEYKTTKLVLRRINPGSFIMGSPTNELGRAEDRDGENEIQHQVTITKPFYIGVFEVTQKQYELVKEDFLSILGDGRFQNSGDHKKMRGDMHPISNVSWNAIRGDQKSAESDYDWPYITDVAPTSFMGIIRAKTGIATFDLPTEAMWEYACRAGTTTALNSGKNLTDPKEDANCAGVAHYRGLNSGNIYYTSVGCYNPNAWGLYDMHGNVAEWCLDWLAPVTSSAAKDPVGPMQSTFLDVRGELANSRVLRGGSCEDRANEVRSARRDGTYPYASSRRYGFRLCCFVTESPSKAKDGSPSRQGAGQKSQQGGVQKADKGDSAVSGMVADKEKSEGAYVSKSKLHARYRSKDRKYVFVEVCHQHDNNMFATPRFTLDRVKAAIKANVDIIFMDMAKSKDGVLFVADPREIEDFTNGTGSVGDYTADQLKRLKVKNQGQLTNKRLATLEEMLKVGKGKILFKLCCFRENAKELDALLERLDAWESVIVESSEVAADQQASPQRLWDNIRLGKLQVKALSSSLPDWRKVTPECTACGGNDDLQAIGMLNIPERVFAAFTYGPGDGGRSDDEAGWEKALKEGVTAFRTDRPQELIKFLKKRGRR